MAHWSDGMEWLNPPAEARQDGAALEVVTAERTDFWQGTFYGFHRDSGHFLHAEAAAEFTAEVTFSGAYEALYDQAGLMVRSNAAHWLKAGVEFTDGVPHLSVVATNGVSDWSVLPMPGLAGPLALRISRHGDALRVQVREGTRWQMVRLAYFPPGGPVTVGPMCCSPERGGFRARFEHFALGPAIPRDLHG